MMNKFKYLFIPIIAAFLAASAQAQNPVNLYDSTLAKELGADDYGMKSYVFILLKTGPNTVDEKPTRDSLFRGHLDNISRLAEAGDMVLAGPFSRNEKAYRGLFILDTPSKEKAREMLQTDPAIRAGLLEAELFVWYGSAALPVYLDTHKKIEKIKP